MKQKPHKENPNIEHKRLMLIVDDVLRERRRACQVHGDGRRRADGITGHLIPAMESIRTLCDIKCERGEETWVHVLAEEFLEAVTEPDAGKLETELIQVASTAINWIAAIRRRKA
jgi:hypothetical protein